MKSNFVKKRPDGKKLLDVAAEVLPTTTTSQPASLDESDKDESDINVGCQMMRCEVM